MIKLKDILLESRDPGMALLFALASEISSGTMQSGGAGAFDDVVDLKQVIYYFQEKRDGKTPRKLSDQQKKMVMAIINTAKKLSKNVQDRLSKQGLSMSLEEQALPDVPMSTGFKPTETYHREIPEQFLRFYNNDGGNKKGRFIDMAEQLVKTYDDPRIQQSLEQIDDVATETQELIAPEANRDLGHNVKSPQDKNINAAVWKYLDDIHETVNSIINNSTFDGWPVETTAAELQGLYDDLEELKNMYSSNYGPAPDQKAIGF